MPRTSRREEYMDLRVYFNDFLDSTALAQLLVEVGLLKSSSGLEPAGPILSVFPALIVHSELKSVHPGFSVAFIF